jgi:inner membrane protease subunit 2
MPIFNILGWGSVAYVVLMHVGSAGRITGHSMSPTINPSVGDKDYVLLNRFVFTKLWYMIQRTDWYRSLFASDPYPFNVGDVVLLTSPFDPNRMTCKRVLALPGDMVSFEDAKGLKHRMRIPPRHIWVEGDVSADGGDRPVRTSRDSRQYGPLHMDLVQSRVDYILWPPARFGRISPRPGFDADHMRHIRHLRQTRSQYGRRGTRHAGRVHSSDSPLSPYVEWEWITDEAAQQGMNLLKDDTDSKRSRRKGRANDEERAELMRKIWNHASRGGRLGDDAKDE